MPRPLYPLDMGYIVLYDGGRLIRGSPSWIDSPDDIGAPLRGALFRYAVLRARGLPKTMLPQKYVHGQVAPLIRMGPPMEPMQHRGTT